MEEKEAIDLSDVIRNLIVTILYVLCIAASIVYWCCWRKILKERNKPKGTDENPIYGMYYFG